MKVMAIGTLKPLLQEQRQRYLPKVVPATLPLYLDGKSALQTGKGRTDRPSQRHAGHADRFERESGAQG